MYSDLYVRRLWSFSRALDLALIDEEVERGFQMAIGERHGERVAYIALSLGKEMGLGPEELVNLTVAGLLHDIGAIADFRHSHGIPERMLQHSLVGAKMVEGFPGGEILSQAILYHHETPDPEHGIAKIETEKIPLFARILSLADKIDVHIPRQLLSHAQRAKILNWVTENIGILFFPEVANVFKLIASREAFWLDLAQPDLMNIVLGNLVGLESTASNSEWKNGFTDLLAETFAELVDQKSQFTARHSHSVAEVVRLLAKGLGWNEGQQREIYTAGLLHDLGKLAMPNKILDKPGKLDGLEIEVIRTHTYYTYRLLMEAGFPPYIVAWASYHHERLDGQGYPFGISEQKLDAGARLMTVADIFAALTEERPYRKALSNGEAFAILEKGCGTSVDPQMIELAKTVL